MIPQYGFWQLIRRFRSTVQNWYEVVPLMQLALPSRWLPHGALHGTRLGDKCVTVRLRSGLRVRCPLSQLYPLVEIFLFPSYEVPGLALSRARQILDVGAHVGWATIWFAQSAVDAQITAVEPDPRWWGVFDHNVKENRLADRVRLLKVAVGNASGGAWLEFDPETYLSHLSTRDKGERHRTEVLSLEDLVKATSGRAVDLLKLDCEGGEYGAILSSSDDVLARIGAITAEYHPVTGHHPAEIKERLMEAGFEVSMSGDGRYGLLTAVRPGHAA